MRKFIAMLLTVALLVTGYGSCFADRVKLPASLLTIEKEAFYGDTSIKEVVVPYGTQYIMARAFAYSGIEKIYIPDTVTFIASNAFDGADDVVICAPEGSYAAAFAEEYDYLLEEDNTEYMKPALTEFVGLLNDIQENDGKEQIILTPYEPQYISTEGITDQVVLEAIAKHNKMEDDIATLTSECIDYLSEAASLINDLGTTFTVSQINLDNSGITYTNNGLSYSISGKELNKIGNDCEIVSVKSDEYGTEMLVEFISNNIHFYMHCNSSGITISSTLSDIQSEKNLTPVSPEAVSNLFIGSNSVSEAISDSIDKIRASIEWLRGKANEISVVLSGLNTKYGDIVSKLEDQLAESEVWAAVVESTQEERDAAKKLKVKLNKAKFTKGLIDKACRVFNVANIVNGSLKIIEDISRFRELLSLKSHGHPTGEETSNPALRDITSELNEELGKALGFITANIVYNTIKIANDILGVVKGISMLNPLLGTLHWTLQIAIDVAWYLIDTYGISRFLNNNALKHYRKAKELDEKLHIAVGGKVTDIDTGEPIKNVLVKCGDIRTYTTGGGLYILYPPIGTKTLHFSKKGYKDEERTVVVNSESTTPPCNVSMTTKGAITGTVVDATTGEPISGVTVQFGDYITTTNSSGRYIFEVKAMSAPLSFSKEGYIPGGGTATVEVGKTKEYPFAMSKKMALGTYRVVLSWGLSPKDLDSHLTKAGEFHVYFSSKSAPNATLDHDDTTSFGPETITFIPDADGTYTYYVHDYTNRNNPGTKALAKSGAVVRVYCGEEQVGIYRVPSNVDLNWTVFTITNGVYKAAG